MTDETQLTSSPLAPLEELVAERRSHRLAELRETGKRLSAKLEVLRSALALRREKGDRTLEALRLDMQAAQSAFTISCERYEHARIAAQSALVSLEREIAQVTKELHAPPRGYGTNVPWQWKRASWAQPMEHGDAREWLPGECFPKGQM